MPHDSGSMIANLDKSLHMVEEAKKSKIARLRYSNRLKDLYAEMQAVKQAVKLEESKLARIQSEIQASHEIIISLKQKRNKLQNAALDLGNGLQGADYRYYNNNNYSSNSGSRLLWTTTQRGQQLSWERRNVPNWTRHSHALQLYYSWCFLQVAGSG